MGNLSTTFINIAFNDLRFLFLFQQLALHVNILLQVLHFSLKLCDSGSLNQQI